MDELPEVNVTGRPDDAVADKAGVAPPSVCVAGLMKEMVCADGVTGAGMIAGAALTTKERATLVAAAKIALPR